MQESARCASNPNAQNQALSCASRHRRKADNEAAGMAGFPQWRVQETQPQTVCGLALARSMGERRLRQREGLLREKTNLGRLDETARYGNGCKQTETRRKPKARSSEPFRPDGGNATLPRKTAAPRACGAIHP